ncbi:MAG TPA: N-acetylmuramoyl-L-alanine amidase [Candidatus Krumholzibacteria bacterium]|nr:N-acetylmuramoyl-L-alanine amidase [Candidatus Krumholzibacteria bacterium]
MKFFCRKTFWVAAAVAIPLTAFAAGRPLVTAVRHSASAEKTRLVLDLSRACDYTVSYLPDSAGVLIRVEGAARSASLGASPVEQNGIRSINAFDRAGGVDVVVDLAGRLGWNDFILPAQGQKPFRIVVDFIPVVPGTGAAPAAAEVADTGDVAAISNPVRRDGGAPRPLVVAIDAGHGGHDAGASGRYGLVEKKLTLDIARRTAEILNRGDGNVRAVLTREGDTYLTLPARNEVAEKKEADVFVSIHLNSAPSSSARGAEIFFVAPAGAESAANKALKSGEAAHEFGLDHAGNDDIVHILLDVNQQSVLARSEQLGESILESVRDRRLLPTRSVKQKSFSVLRTISMPSVLVECGFLTNASDAKLLRDPAGRDKIARAIADGVESFHRAHPPQRADDQSGRAVVHRVQRGDTLWDLSKRYQTTVARLRQLNGMRRSDDLRVGQEILVEPGR